MQAKYECLTRIMHAKYECLTINSSDVEHFETDRQKIEFESLPTFVKMQRIKTATEYSNFSR